MQLAFNKSAKIDLTPKAFIAAGQRLSERCLMANQKEYLDCNVPM